MAGGRRRRRLRGHRVGFPDRTDRWRYSSRRRREPRTAGAGSRCRSRSRPGAAAGAVGQSRPSLVTLDTGQRSGKVEPAVELAASADAFLPGQRDLAPLWPGIPPQDALRGLVRRGVRTAVIKLGTSGSMGIHDGAITSMPAYPVTASGTTGGGDAYAGAFSAMFAADRDLPRAMAWASAAASVVVESFATLDPLNEFGRGKVAYRARILEAEARVRNDFARTSEAESSTRFALP